MGAKELSLPSFTPQCVRLMFHYKARFAWCSLTFIIGTFGEREGGEGEILKWIVHHKEIQSSILADLIPEIDVGGEIKLKRVNLILEPYLRRMYHSWSRLRGVGGGGGGGHSVGKTGSGMDLPLWGNFNPEADFRVQVSLYYTLHKFFTIFKVCIIHTFFHFL